MLLAEKLFGRLPVDEHATTLALDHFMLSLTPTHAVEGETPRYDAEHALSAVLRTGGIYVIEYPGNAFEVPPPPELDLPPLPLRRLWVEARDGENITSLCRFYDEERDAETFIFGLGVIERTEGVEWDLVTVGVNVTQATARRKKQADFDEPVSAWSSPDRNGLIEHAAPAVMRYNAAENRIVSYMGQGNVGEAASGDGASEWLRGLAVNAIHLITAKRVPRIAATWSRQARRAFERRHGIPFPILYYVDLNEAGETRLGVSDRIYVHRWLVQGHWRLNENGQKFIEHKGGLCVWVKPYVKGPAGAPWKGRPIYRRRGEPAATTA